MLETVITCQYTYSSYKITTLRALNFILCFKGPLGIQARGYIIYEN